MWTPAEDWHNKHEAEAWWDIPRSNKAFSIVSQWILQDVSYYKYNKPLSDKECLI